jgi:hypothetical protein
MRFVYMRLASGANSHFEKSSRLDKSDPSVVERAYSDLDKCERVVAGERLAIATHQEVRV